jgi:hypothetical protein
VKRDDSAMMRPMNANPAHAALRRMLSNGPLTGWPRRPADQELLVELAAARFEHGREYREAEVNDTIRAWLETFCAPYGIDHVTMRRMLVDARHLVREKNGSAYRANTASPREEPAVDPAQVLEQVGDERAARKRSHPGSAS